MNILMGLELWVGGTVPGIELRVLILASQVLNDFHHFPNPNGNVKWCKCYEKQ
jgi:hypothetical protein